MSLELPPSRRVEAVFDRLTEIPIVDAADYGEGLCRRRIRMINVSSTRTVGELEDDFHHFRVDLDHDGETIERVAGTPLRGPWSTCMEVGEPLRAIEGQQLSPRSTAIGGYAPATHNCTHLFDLAGLTVAHALRDVEVRQYDLAITDPVDGVRHELSCWRDGSLVLHWGVEAGEITSPSEWAGAPLQSKFIPWAEERLDLDTAEACIVLRRMLHISMGRGTDLDATETGGEHTDGPIGRCYSYQPERIVTAVRLHGSIRDFTDPDDGAMLLADMHLRGGDA